MPFLTAVLTAAVWISCFNFPIIWTLTGIGEGDKPFLDLCNLLSAGESLQRGLDPFVHNPFDPYNRPHGYTTWLLVTGPLGLTLADAAWLGAIMLGATLASAVWLLRPANWKQGGSLLLVLVSPPLLLAASRANHDLVVFVLMCGTLACFRSTLRPLRAFGVLLLAVSAVLKYFPLAAALLLLEARTRREFLGWCLLYSLVLVLAWPGLEPGLRSALQLRPAPSWLYAFGAPVVFRDFHLAVPAILIAIAFLLAVGACRLAVKPAPAGPPAASGAAEREFICGAVMVVGCFVHGSSYAYKLVFALWLLPWLWRAPPADRLDRITYPLLLAVLWLEGTMAVVINLSVTFSFWTAATGERVLEATLVVSQLLGWALAVILGRSLLLYAQRQLQRLGFFPT